MSSTGLDRDRAHPDDPDEHNDNGEGDEHLPGARTREADATPAGGPVTAPATRTPAGAPAAPVERRAAGDAASGTPTDAGGPDDREGEATPGTARPALDGLSRSDRRRLRRAWALAVTVVLVGYAWVLTVGTWDLLQTQYFDDFFDVQARSFLDGRLDVPLETVGFEGFLIDGKTYIYFGPVPALLRVPILAVTDSLDGRLTTLSMLLAMVVLAAGTFRLACLLRWFVRGAAPVGRREPTAMVALAPATLCAPPFFLASQAVVYHEATIWGLALAVLAFDSVARWALRPTGWRLVGTTALITATVLSRQSLGLAPLVALALVCATYLWRHARSRPGRWWVNLDRQATFVLGVALAVPALAPVAVNYAKFETLLTPPSSAHVHSRLYGHRQEVLEENGGSLFGLGFAPTTLTQYVRPDGIDIRRDFPWIDFPRFGPSQLGDMEFDRLDWSSSIPASAPALTAGAVVTGVAAWRRRRRRGRLRRFAPGLRGRGPDRGRSGAGPPEDGRSAGPLLRAPWLPALVLGTVAGSLGVIAFGYVANRYLNDLFPAILIPGIVGFHLVVARAAAWSRLRRTLAVGATAGLVLLGALVNLALALSYQRERGPVVLEEWRAEWAGWQVNLPGAYSPYLVSEALPIMPRPRHVFDGRLAVVGDCDGMYLHREDRWYGVERGPGVGVYDLVVDLGDVPGNGRRVPLMTLGRRDFTSIVAIVRLDEDTVRVDVSAGPRYGSGWTQGMPVDLSGEVTLRIDADHREVPTGVTLGRTVLNAAPIDNDDHSDAIGRAPAGRGVATSFPGRLRLDPVDPVACEKALTLVDYDEHGFPIIEG